jgi:hypothetical protein
MIDEYLALFGRILATSTSPHPSPNKRIGSPGLFSHSLP